MTTTVLRDPNAARQYLQQGLWLQHVVPPTSAGVAPVLHWCLAIAESGQPLPPSGFVGDVGNLALGRTAGRRAKDAGSSAWPPAVSRAYEDLIFGPSFGDVRFERAAAAIRRLDADKQPRGIAYLLRQMRENVRFGGMELPPGIVRGLLQSKPEEMLRQGWESLKQTGPMPELMELYQQVIAGARHAPRLLAAEDVIALEQQTALLPLAEYVAHRQILQAATRLEEGLPRLPPAPSSATREAPTKLLDEDFYPVGGYSSISTKGSIESLLHSQLAYMESDERERPDLFDIKFLRDELYYYSRDENRFLRRRRAFLFILHPDLIAARYKDTELPFQRSVLVLSLLLAACRRLTEWLSSDGLTFEFLFLEIPGQPRLEEEHRLLHLLFREEMENKSARVERMEEGPLRKHVRERTEMVLTNSLVIRTKEAENDEAEIAPMTLLVNGPRPELIHERKREQSTDETLPLEAWSKALTDLLRNWI